jgi:hypothetical protein
MAIGYAWRMRLDERSMCDRIGPGARKKSRDLRVMIHRHARFEIVDGAGADSQPQRAEGRKLVQHRLGR